MTTPTQPIYLAKVLNPIITAKAVVQEYSNQITIYSESGCEDDVFFPAQNINIYGTKALEALRDLCTEALKSQQDLKDILRPPIVKQEGK